MIEFNNKKELDFFIKLVLFFLTIASIYLAIVNQFSVILGSDLYVVVRAVNEFSIGVDPYRHMAQSMFIYHPYVLKILVGINSFIPILIFLISFYLLSIIWFGKQSYKWLMQQQTLATPKHVGVVSILLMSISFGGVAIASFACGNLSTYFHLVLIGLIFNYSLNKKFLTLFVLGLAIVIFSVVKPYLLAYVLVYFLFLKKRQALLFAGSISICGLIWLSGTYFQAEMYERFASALQYHILTKEDLGGFSSLRILGPILGIKTAFVAHLAFVSFALYSLFFIIPDKINLMQKPANQLLVMLLLIIFINPRLVYYDFYVGVFLLFYLIYINFPITCYRIVLPGFLVALISQLAAHPSRWVIFAYSIVVLTFILTVVLFRPRMLQPKFSVSN